jgi:hypothetical protein
MKTSKVNWLLNHINNSLIQYCSNNVSIYLPDLTKREFGIMKKYYNVSRELMGYYRFEKLAK